MQMMINLPQSSLHRNTTLPTPALNPIDSKIYPFSSDKLFFFNYYQLLQQFQSSTLTQASAGQLYFTVVYLPTSQRI